MTQGSGFLGRSLWMHFKITYALAFWAWVSLCTILTRFSLNRRKIPLKLWIATWYYSRNRCDIFQIIDSFL